MIGNASAFRINSDQGLKYYNSTSAKKSQLNVTPDGILDVNQIGNNKNPVDNIHSESINTDNLFTTNRASIAGVEFIAADQDAQTIIEGAAEGTAFHIEHGATFDVADMTIPRGSTFHGGALAASTETGLTAGENPDLVTFRKAADGNLATYSHNTTFRNIEFDGNKANYTGDGVVEREDDVAFPRFVGCWIHDCAGDGWVRGSSARAVFDQGVIEYNDGYGIHAGEGVTLANPRHSRVVQSPIRENGAGGVRYDRTPWNERFDSRIIDNSGPGVEFRTSGNTAMKRMQFGGSFFGNDGPAIYQNGTGVFEGLILSGHFRRNGESVSVSTTGDIGGAVHIEATGGNISCTQTGGFLASPAAGTDKSLSNQSAHNMRCNLLGDGAIQIAGGIDVFRTSTISVGTSASTGTEVAIPLGGPSIQINGQGVVGERSINVGVPTDNTGGSTDGILEAVSGSGADATINDNFAELRQDFNRLVWALGVNNHGLIKDNNSL